MPVASIVIFALTCLHILSSFLYTERKSAFIVDRALNGFTVWNFYNSFTAFIVSIRSAIVSLARSLLQTDSGSILLPRLIRITLSPSQVVDGFYRSLLRKVQAYVSNKVHTSHKAILSRINHRLLWLFHRVLYITCDCSPGSWAWRIFLVLEELGYGRTKRGWRENGQPLRGTAGPSTPDKEPASEDLSASNILVFFLTYLHILLSSLYNKVKNIPIVRRLNNEFTAWILRALYTIIFALVWSAIVRLARSSLDYVSRRLPRCIHVGFFSSSTVSKKPAPEGLSVVDYLLNALFPAWTFRTLFTVVIVFVWSNVVSLGYSLLNSVSGLLPRISRSSFQTFKDLCHYIARNIRVYISLKVYDSYKVIPFAIRTQASETLSPRT